MNFIYEYFSQLERQGPGSVENTKIALSFITGLDSNSNIADLGCGTGSQTMVLADHLDGNIKGYDTSELFIYILNKNAKTDRVKGIVGSMDDYSLIGSNLDLIWSEGAIYNIGFKRGINEWYKLLNYGGYIAVTEATWLTDERPQEIEEFWNNEYPEIDTIDVKIQQLKDAGYTDIKSFIIPENCWIDNYYAPQQLLNEQFLKDYPGDEGAKMLVDDMKKEAELYYKYKEHYGYVFYIGRK
jgi:SAM-dependent methyltransferase